MSLLGRSQFTTSPWWHRVLTTAGFILSVRTMWGEVAHFPLLQTLPSVAGKPRQRAGRDRGNICHNEIIVICCKRINLINIFIEVAALIFKKHCNLHKNVFFLVFLRVTGTRGRLMHIYIHRQFSSIQIKYINVALMD